MSLTMCLSCALAVRSGNLNSIRATCSNRKPHSASLLDRRPQRRRRNGISPQVERNVVPPRPKPRRLGQRFRRSLSHTGSQAWRPVAATFLDARTDPPRSRAPRTMVELPGFDQGLHQRFRYGYSDAWQQFIIERAQAAIASQPLSHPPNNTTLVDISPVASLKAPQAPLTFPARPTFAPGAGPAPAFKTPPSFAYTSSQVLPGAVHLPERAPPQTLGSAFSPLSLESAFVFTTTSAPTSRTAVVQSVPGLLLPPVGLGAQISPEASTPAFAKRAP